MPTTSYTCRTRVGLFSISLDPDGSWRLTLEDEVLGFGYETPQAAAVVLSSDHFEWTVVGDLGSGQPPAHLDAWIAHRTG